MDLSASVLGRHVVTYLSDSLSTPVLTIGRDKFNRAALAGVACFNFTAAANLSRVLNHDLQVKDTRDVFEHVHPDRFVLPRLGPISLAVLGAAFEAKGLGGATPLHTWFQKHREGRMITFASLKAHHDEDVARSASRHARKKRHA